MKITDYIAGTRPKEAGESKKVQSDKKSDRTETSSSANGGDTVELSSRSKEIARALETVRTAPEVRTERVAELKAEIGAGTYKVDSGAVAGKILIEGLSDKL